MRDKLWKQYITAGHLTIGVMMPFAMLSQYSVLQSIASKSWKPIRLSSVLKMVYGVTILPISQEEEVLEVLVLRFYGEGSNDYHVAQYSPIPELNRGSFDEILDLCKQVALLPRSKARARFSGPAPQ